MKDELMGLAVSNIRNQIKTYITDNHIKSLVIGVSGGIDSALCCALARPVCDELNIPLIGRSIPIESNKQDEIDRARKVGESFCHEFKTVDLTDFYRRSRVELCDFENNCGLGGPDHLETKIRLGNVKARIRMIRLYDIAQASKGMVLSTDNLTELLLGFWSLHGDVGDYGMIQNLWKTEVYTLTEYLVETDKEKFGVDGQCALDECVVATPTDGLDVTNSDLDQLKASSYDEVDKILKIWLTLDEDCFFWDDWLKYDGREEDYKKFIEVRKSYENHPIVQRYKRTYFKRNNPINISRHELFEERG